MKKAIFVVFLIVLSGILAAETLITNNITASQIWTLTGSPYIIVNNIAVVGSAPPVLTIEAGVEVRFNAGRTLTIGHTVSTMGGAIVANGTELAPVVFTANSDTPTEGFWNFLKTELYTHTASVFTHTVFEYGGSGSNGMFGVNNAQADYVPQFYHCAFRRSASYGLFHLTTNASIGALVQDCLFEDNLSYPMLVNANQVYKIDTGNSFVGNAPNRILLRDVTIATTQTWLNHGIAYEAESDLRVQTLSGGLLQISPGTEVCFRAGKYLYIGYTSSSFNGGLEATGVNFSGCDGAAWYGIQFQPYITASSMVNCTVRDVSAASMAAVYLRNTNTTVSLTGCAITANGGYAIHAIDTALFSISGTNFNANSTTISVSASDFYKLGSGNTYTGNTDNRVHCRGGIISAPATWINQGTPVLISSNITHRIAGGGTLQIGYGSILEFASGVSFSVGYTSSSFYGDLSASGVIFRGANASAGYWQGLLFERYGGSSVLSGCIVRDAGFGNVGAIRVKAPSGTITGCEIFNCLGTGVYYDSNIVQVALTGNVIRQCGSYPLSLPANCVRAIGLGNNMADNALNKVEVRAENLSVSCTWINPGVPYFLNANITILASGNCHLKILPGTVLYLPAGGYLLVGHTANSMFGSLEAEEVTFTSDPAGSISYGLYYNSYINNALCLLTNCTFENLQNAANNCAVYVNNTFPTFVGCYFRNNPGSGIAGSANAKFTLTDCIFLNNGFYPVRTSAPAFDAVSGTGNYFSGNTPNRIQITGGTLDQNYTWDNPGIPVEVTSNILVRSGAGCTLKVNSGLTLLFYPSISLQIGHTASSLRGTIQADGATFSALDGSSGGWNGIIIYPYTITGGYLRNCIVEYAGGNGNVYVNNSPFPLIEGCVLRHGIYGVYLSGVQSLTAIVRNYIQSNGVGIYCASSANPLIGGTIGDGNSLEGNTTYGVQNTTTSILVNAEYNWWGHESGPTHSGNPGGLGDIVTNYVDYDPWRSTNIGDAPARFHLLTPANASMVQTFTPVLDWEEALDPTPGDVVTYDLYLARNAAFTVGLQIIPAGTSSIYHVPDEFLSDNTRYYWKVTATDTQEQITNSYENYFWFDVAVPEYPMPFGLLAPGAGVTVNFTSNLLSWEPSIDPDPGDFITYTAYVDVTAGFENPQTYATSGTSVYTGFCQPGSLFYWKVKAEDQTGRARFTDFRYFFVHPDARPRPPVAFTLTPVGADLLLEWDSVPGADSYDVYHSTSPYDGFTLLQSGVLGTSHTHWGAAAGAQGYYYVTAHDTQ